MISILTYTSLICGGILILMMLMSLLAGLDLDFDVGDADADVDSSGSLGFIKSFLTFVSVSTWVMKILMEGDHGQTAAIVVGLISGIIAVGILSYIFKLLLKNEENVNWKMEDALFQTGKVYLKIPGGSKTGIVQVLVNGVMRELKAKSDGEAEIPTGASVLIKDMDNEIAIVEQS